MSIEENKAAIAEGDAQADRQAMLRGQWLGYSIAIFFLVLLFIVFFTGDKDAFRHCLWAGIGVTGLSKVINVFSEKNTHNTAEANVPTKQ